MEPEEAAPRLLGEGLAGRSGLSFSASIWGGGSGTPAFAEGPSGLPSSTGVSQAHWRSPQEISSVAWGTVSLPQNEGEALASPLFSQHPRASWVVKEPDTEAKRQKAGF